MLRASVTALLGAGLCAIGGAFDTASLYVPGVALVAASALAVAWVALAARGARIVRLPVPATVVEDEPFALRVEATLRWLPAPGGAIADPLADRELALGGRLRARLDATATLPRRGRTALAPSTLTLRDPLRLCSRRVVGSPGPEVLVLPSVEPVTADGAGGDTGAGGRRGVGRAGDGLPGIWRDDAADGLDLDGLRRYREGAPASRIHWPTLARRGEMMERRFVSERASATLVVLDAATPASAEALDAAVRAAASLCVALARAGGVALLLPGDRRPVGIGHDLGSWPGVHKRLALVEAGAQPDLGGLAPGTAALIWVTASRLAGLPRGLERLPARARFLVAPELPADLVASFAVAGCAGATVERRHRSAAA